ncbi:MAG: sigma-70 family RNA polymerase sigma factor [Terracidiphilus sp.]|jgi:RNA polymerase sigma-70 factor (ECF subfamily)
MDSLISRQLESDAAIAPRAIGNEWALVQRAMAGEANAMDLLFAPHMRGLYRVALVMLRNKEDAEDALQDGLYKACSCLGSFQGRSSFSTWLTRIVMNSALMTLRRRRSHSESSMDEVEDKWPEWLAHVAADKRPNPEQVCALVELNALIEEQTQKLPTFEQTAFRYFAIHGFSMRESCQALGIPEATFKSRILRTRRKLAHRLQHSLGEACGTSPKGKSSHVAQH